MSRRRRKPFSPETSIALMELASSVFEMQGFRRMPVRPATIVNGRVRLSAAWKKPNGEEMQTVRVTISRPRRPA